MRRLINLLCLIIVLSLITGCTTKLNIDIGKALVSAGEEMEQVKGVKDTAYSYNNDNDSIKLRIMVEDSITLQQAETYIKDFLKKVSLHSEEEVWKYYSASIDIKNYQGEILYEGTRQIGDEKININRK
jgi:hypothetical protein